MEMKRERVHRRWKCTKGITILLILCSISKSSCQTVNDSESSSKTKTLDNTLESSTCHTCQNSQDTIVNRSEEDSFVGNLIESVSEFCEKYVFVNNTERDLSHVLERAIDEALNKERYEIFDGFEIKSVNVNKTNAQRKEDKEARALFSSYTYEYRLFKKVKDFVDTHILSINLPKAARLIGFRSFGLKKFFLPLIIGMQVFKSILLAMFLPSILGSFGKILGKGISHLSATSSQASYPPANTEDPNNYDNKDFMGYETNQAGTYAYAQEYGNGEGDSSDLANVDMSRFGMGGQKVSYLPSKNSYYKNQMTNNYKMFQKIPASSMILSNYDPFYSPLLSRLDGIFARLGLAPTETATNEPQVGSQNLSDAKLEACREQLICLMYANPAKYAPYSNLVSAQLSRELNELRRPVSDNPEILRFFKYMRAARRGQEGTDCLQFSPGCTVTTPTHTMIAAYHDINKLVSARRLQNL
ncbi:unnamed protein product [Leptosia nina]|uniref:Uncharacterized protein n=1 Tax=Leptosia nina TaxID=320188 RepID=A0AAV1IWV5_9NEOP